MILSFDIDGVLARQNNRAYMRACNIVLKLGFSEEDLAHLDYRQFLARTEVTSVAPKTLEWMYYHPLSLAQAKVIKGAQQGVETLYQAIGGSVQYCTARYSSNAWWNNSMQKATMSWLLSNGFPKPENVVFCEGYEDKALRLQCLSEREPVLHIDDSWERLMPLPSSLYLAAFGTNSVDHVGVYALPSWQGIQQVIDSIEGAFHGTVFQDPQTR